MPKLVQVAPLDRFRVRVTYSEGVEGIADFSDLAGQGVFRAWSEPGVFEAVHVSEAGALAWDDELEICPDATYLRVTGRSPEDVFPRLKQAGAHAGT